MRCLQTIGPNRYGVPLIPKRPLSKKEGQMKMIAGQIFYSIALVLCTWGGLMDIREWYRTRHTDLRPFSWKRWFSKDEGLNPREKLINGIIGIIIGAFAALIFLSSL